MLRRLILDSNMCLALRPALREGLFHHGPGDRAVILGYGVTHTLHGDMRRLGRQIAHAEDNECELGR